MEKKATSDFVNLVASIITVFSCVLVVEYTPGDYDAWDLLIGVIILTLCWNFKDEFSKNKFAFILSRLGLSLSAMIILFAVVTFINESCIKCIGIFKWKIFDGSFITLCVLFFLSLVLYKRGGPEGRKGTD